MDTQVADLLGGERVLGASVKSNLDLARATRQGLPAETAVELVEAIRGSDVRPEAGHLSARRDVEILLQELDVDAEVIGLPAMGPLRAPDRLSPSLPQSEEDGQCQGECLARAPDPGAIGRCNSHRAHIGQGHRYPG
jgi:hypothetical protein